MTDEETANKIKCSVGSLSMTVQGADEEWVRETFRDEWAERMHEAEDISKALRDGSRGCL